MLKLKPVLKRQKMTVSRLRIETNGNVSILSAVSLSALLLGVTVTIDLTSTFRFKADMQEALDTAVLAAASNANDDFSTIGQTTFDLSISEHKLAALKANFEKQNIHNGNHMVGTATGSIPLLFSGVFKQSSMDITVSSTVLVYPSCITTFTQTDKSGLTDRATNMMNTSECEKLVPTKFAKTHKVGSDTNYGVNAE